MLIDSRRSPRGYWKRAHVERAVADSAGYGRKEIGLDVSARERRAGCPVSHEAVGNRYTDRVRAIRQSRRSEAAHLFDAIEHDALARRGVGMVSPWCSIAMRGHSGSALAMRSAVPGPSACADGIACIVMPLTNATTDNATTRRWKTMDIMGHAYNLSMRRTQVTRSDERTQRCCYLPRCGPLSPETNGKMLAVELTVA